MFIQAMRLLGALLIFGFAGTAHAGPKRIMVYPIKNLAKAAPSALITLRDTIRTEAGRHLPSKHFKIIDNANLTVASSGKSWAECKAGTKCEIETARKINLDYFVIGKLTSMETQLFITVQAWATENGNQIGSFQVEGASLLKLKNAMTQELGGLMAQVAQVEGVKAVSKRLTAVPSVTGSAPQADAFSVSTGGPRSLISFRSNPDGARVLVNGTERCETPCDKKLAGGRYTIAMSKLNYVQREESLNLDGMQTLNWALVKDVGKLVISSSVGDDQAISIDGPDGPVSVREKTPATLELTPGAYTVVVGDPACAKTHTQTVHIVRGQTTESEFRPAIAFAGLQIDLVDGRNNDLAGEIYIEGKNIGSSLAAVKIPVCTDEVEVRHPEYPARSIAVTLEKGKTQQLRIVMDASDGAAAGRSITGTGEQLYVQGQALVDKGDWVGATRFLEQAVAKDFGRAHGLLAWAYKMQGNATACVANAQIYLALHPDGTLARTLRRFLESDCSH